MSIGMKRGTVYLESHQPEWGKIAEETVRMIKSILGDAAVDVQHIGSTSIRHIKAKPIIDIAVGVGDYDAVTAKTGEFEKAEIIFRIDERPEQLLFVKGDFENDTRTHHIHVVLYGSREWNDYLDLRDYLNADKTAAEEYERVKAELAERYPDDRGAYTEGKSEIIASLLKRARAWRKDSR